jgi:hypothetical protein
MNAYETLDRAMVQAEGDIFSDAALEDPIGLELQASRATGGGLGFFAPLNSALQSELTEAQHSPRSERQGNSVR